MSDSQVESAETQDPFEGLVSFPRIQFDENPEDATALQLILSGQASQRCLYDTLLPLLAESGSVESGFLIKLLESDAHSRFTGLSAEGRTLLENLSPASDGESVSIEPVPRAEAVARLAGSLEFEPLELAGTLLAYADRALVASRLVPWKSDVGVVFEFFLRAVEAEGQHRDLVDQFRRLLANGE